jgi:hypothetical protein
MGFTVKRYGSYGHGWLSQPMQPFNDGDAWARGFAPRRYAETFPTREHAQLEIDALVQRTPGLFQFEIDSE